MQTKSFKQPPHNRRYIASLALDYLMPFVKLNGKLVEGTIKMPPYQMLDIGGMHVVVSLDDGTALAQRPTLDIWYTDVGKIFSLCIEPMEIVSFRPGPWIDQLIELSLRISAERNQSN